MIEPPQVSPRQLKWRLGIYAAIAMTFLALIPQLHLWILRGSDWQGASVSFDFDEVAYASYLNALLDGRPRRNDPYSGRDDSPDLPLPESLHSIQFLPAYAIALPARIFGVSTGVAFIAVRALSAFASTLVLFWLLFSMTNNSQVAAAGAVIVLCLGGLAGEPHDAWRIISLRGTGETLPFLRAYVPSLVFPLFWIFIAAVWQALQREAQQELIKRSVFAGLLLATLIFSYFFLWTAAVAWLFVICSLWFTLRRKGTRGAIIVFTIIAVISGLTLVPYAMLLNRRAGSIDSAQLLTHSHAPVFSLPVIIGVIVLLALVIAIQRKQVSWRTPAVLLTASLALLPAVTFNQQVVTGLLLQPVHYGRYVSNYASVLAAFLTILFLLRRNHDLGQARAQILRPLWTLTLLVFCWSVVETSTRSGRLISHQTNVEQAYLVGRRLRELAKEFTPSSGGSYSVVFSSDLLLSDRLPNITPLPVLWSPHLFVFSGTSAAENRERLYQQLYYSGTSEAQFASMAGNPSFLQLAIFGWERMNQKSHALPISKADVESETKLYRDYLAHFDADKASRPRLACVVVPTNGGPSLNNLSRWYTLDAGERVGEFVIHRATLR